MPLRTAAPHAKAARCAGLLGLAFALAAADARAATISLQAGSVVRAYTESGSDSVLGPTPPAGSVAYSFPGAASASTTSYDVSDPDARLRFDVRHAHDPAGAYGPFPVVACDPFCAGSTATIRFQAAGAVGYTLSGSYAAADEHGRAVAFRVQLLDLTAGTELFAFEDGSAGAPNASFGAGPSSGTLVAGRDYQLTLAADLRSDLAAAGLASASGFVELSFAPVPEPGTAVLTGVGLAGCAAARRGRRQTTTTVCVPP